MAAAGVRPKPGKVILAVGPALQQQPLLGFEDEDGEGAMEQSIPVHLKLAAGAAHPVAPVPTGAAWDAPDGHPFGRKLVLDWAADGRRLGENARKS